MGSKIDVNFERPILQRILMIFEVREVEKSIKNRSKNDQTSNMLVLPASKTRCSLLSRVRSATGTAGQFTLADPDLHAREELTAAFLGCIQLAHGV